MRVLLPGLLLLLCACASTASTGAERSPEPRMEVSLRLEQLPGEEGWLVHYRLSRPVTAVRFQRSGRGFRQSHWKVLQPEGARLEPGEGSDVLSTGDGRAFQEIRIRIAQYAVKPEKEYQVFIPFSRGGVLVFTGAFGLEPLEGGAGAPSGTVENRITLVPREGERLVASGKVHTRPLEREPLGEGTYVLFGDLAPAESEHLVMVSDPALPEWLGQMVAEHLPKLFAYYAERTGHPLRSKPAVFVNYGEEPKPRGLSLNGGVLEGLVQVEIRLGSGYRGGQDPAVAESFFKLLAHEAAHLWNTGLINHEVQGGDWMHEGGADAFAFRALRHFGIISEERFLDYLSESASRCAAGLEGQVLRESGRAGRYGNYYTCGSTLELIAEAAARRFEPGVDVFTLWRKLFELAGPGGRYDEQLFFRALAEVGVPPGRVEQLRALVEQPGSGVEAQLVQALREEGLGVELHPEQGGEGSPRAHRIRITRRP